MTAVYEILLRGMVDSSTLPHTLAGFCVGLSETLVGYPFVTAKVLIQNRQSFWGLRWRRYYQGVKYPLVSSVGFNTLVFPLHDALHDRGYSHVLSGGLAGLAVTPQTWFIDTFTIRRQTDQRVGLGMFRGARGFGMTSARETTALGVYFGTYHKVRESCNSVVSGGAAGLANWTLTYPLDTLRTRQIAQRCGVREALAQGRLWRGYGVAAARAIVVNAASFTVYEQSLQLFKRWW